MAESDLSIRIIAENLARAAFQDAEADADSLQGKLQSFGESATAMGTALSIGLTAPIVGVGVESVHMAASFDESMQKIVALVGIGQDQVDAWRTDILSLSEETGKSSKDMADALFFITSAGLRGSDAMDALKASAEASVAGLGDMKTVADAATSAMNAYKGEGLSAADATGILVAAVREGKMPAQDLAGSIGRVIPIASQMGVGFDQVAASIAAMTREGLSSDEAATAIRATLTALLKPGKDASDALKEVGLSADGIRQVVAEQGLLPALQLLKDRIGDNDAAFSRIFPNVRALTGVLNLVGQNADDVNTLFQNLAHAGAEDLSTAFETMAATPAQQIRLALNSIEQALQGLGAVLLPMVVPALQTLTQGVQAASQWFQSLDPSVQHAILGFAGFAAAIGPVLVVVGSLATLIAALISPIGLVIAAVGALGAAWEADFLGIPSAITTAVNDIVGRFQFLTEQGLDPLSAALQATSDFIREAFGGDVANIFDAFTHYLGDAASALGTFVSTLQSGDIVGAVRGLSDAISTTLLPDLANLADAFGSWVQDAIPQVVQGLGDLMSAIGSWISDNGPTIAQEFVSDWLPSFIEWNVQVRVALVEKLAELVGDILNWISDNGPTIAQEFISDWVPSFIEWVLGTALPAMIEKLADLLAHVIAWLIDQVPRLASALQDFFTSSVEDASGQAMPRWLDVGVRLVEAIINGIIGMGERFASDITNWLGERIGTVDVGGMAQQLGQSLVEGIKQGLLSAAGGLGSAITGIVTGALDDAKNALGIHSPSSLTRDEIGAPIAAGIVQGIADGQGAAANAMTGFVSAIAASMQAADLQGQFGRVGGNAVNAIINAFQEGTPQAGSAAGNAVTQMIQAAITAGVPRARELGQQLSDTVQEALATGDAALIDSAVQQIADLYQAMSDQAANAGRQKLIDGFNTASDAAVQALALKMGPDEGGGIVNVFMGAMYQSLADSSPTLARNVEQLAVTVTQTLQRNLSPADARAAVADWTQAFNAYWAQGDVSGVEDFMNRYGDALSTGLDKQKGKVRTAADSFFGAISEVAQSSDMVAQFGQEGAKAVQALTDAMDPESTTGKQSAAKAGNAIQALIQAAEKAGVPAAAELGATITQEIGQALTEHNPELLATGEQDLANLFSALQQQTATTGAQKLADGFNAMANKALEALQIKMSPSQGGGLANVFIGAMQQAIDDGSGPTAQHAQQLAQQVISAITSDRALSPTEASALIGDFNAAVQQAFATGDLSGVTAWIHAHETIIDGGLTQIKTQMEQAVPPMAAIWHDAAAGIGKDWTKTIDGMSAYTDAFVKAQKSAAAAIQDAFSQITYGGYGNQGYTPPIGTPGNPGPGGLPPNSPGQGTGGPILPPQFGSSSGSNPGGGLTGGVPQGPPQPPSFPLADLTGYFLNQFGIMAQSMTANGVMGPIFTSEIEDPSGAIMNHARDIWGAQSLDDQIAGLATQVAGDQTISWIESGGVGDWPSVLAMAQGGSGIVSSPTLFLAGEAGPESFSFSPLGRGSGGPVVVEFHYHQDAPVYGPIDFEQQVAAAVTSVARRGGLSQLGIAVK